MFLTDQNFFQLVYNLLVDLSNKADDFKNLISTSIQSYSVVVSQISGILNNSVGLSAIFTPMLIMLYLSSVFVAIDIARDLI